MREGERDGGAWAGLHCVSVIWEIFLSFNFQGSDLGLCCCNLRLNEVQCSGVRSRCLGSMIQPNVHIYNHCICSVLQSYSSSLCFTVYTTGLWAVLYCIVHYTILYNILYSTVLDCTTALHGTGTEWSEWSPVTCKLGKFAGWRSRGPHLLCLFW